MNDKRNKPDPKKRSGIGTLNEFSLHAEIIQKLAREGDVLEAELEGYFIDILRGNQIIEVQTRNLGKLVKKAYALAGTYQVEIVYPIAELKYIVRHSAEGEPVSRRKSPKKGRVVDVFNEIVNATTLISPENVVLTVLLIETDEIWKDDGHGSWRRQGWSISERRLVNILGKRRFSQPEDLLVLLPDALPSPFTNAQLAQMLNVRGRLAGKITYTLRKMGVLSVVGRQGRAYLFDAI